MKNRSSYAVLTRFGIIAAILATLVLIAPAATAQSECEMDGDVVKCDYLEGGTEPVATFTAEDPDADAGDIKWTLSGVDKDIFKISDDGVLTFDKVPNYEAPKDGDESEDAGLQGFEDNVYKVTVQAAGGADTVIGTHDVEVTVEDVDEDGSVSFNKPQPQVGRGLVATFKDDDDPLSDVSWQWSRGPSMDGPWTEVGSAAATGSRNPVEGDIDSYLLATVTYTDRHGSDKTASKATDNKVEARTVANAAPDFGTIDAITIDEGDEGAIGDPVVATDADDIHLLYSIVEEQDTATPPAATSDYKRFSIDRNTGQLSLVKALDYEMTDDGEADDAVATGADDTEPSGNTSPDEVYTFKIRAEDPSGAPGIGTVTVNLRDVNEAPVFLAPGKDQKTLYIVEGTAGATIYPTADLDTGTPSTQATYTADDLDIADGAAEIRFSLEGSDNFSVSSDTAGGDTGVTLTAAASFTADYEGTSEHKVTIVATSGGTAADRGDREMVSRLPVTIMVVDIDDVESVKLSSREPQVGIAVLATLDEEDADVNTVTWKWFRGSQPPADDTARDTLVTALVALEVDPEVDATRICGHDDNVTAVTNAADGSTACVIPGATSALYTPVTADSTHTLHAIATYNDKFNTGTTRANALGSSEKAAQVSDPANTAPKFPDQDLNTAGDQSDVAMRSVAEAKKDLDVGTPLEAEDANGDLLTYALTGPDADSFKLADLSTGSNSVQIQTAVALDFETQAMHEVVLTAMDPSGATDSITVMITVTNVDEGAIITLSAAPVFDEGETAERMVAENSEAGMAVGDPVTATDANGDDLTYSLGGDDAMYFAIDAMSGQISVGEGTMLDYESDKMSYSVTVTADDGTGRSSMIAVTIMVTDVEESPCVNGGAVSQADSGSYLDMDCQTLLDAMEELIGDGDGTLNWSAETPIGEWQGVAQRGTGRVGGIQLADAGLAGMIPASFSDLAGLQRLNLRDNDLGGDIPDLSGLDNLEYLTLQRNAFTGALPDWFGDMESLERLYIYSNEGGFEGGVPAGLGNSTSLIQVWLYDNGLTGKIPTEIGDMSRLRYLVLDNNMLTGEIPAELAGATNLKQLYLHNNMLSGMIPAELGNIMTNADDTLRRLYLNNNMLSGDVPSSLGMLTSLTNLRLNGNMLTGCIPAGIFDAVDDGLDLMACADDGS